MKEYNYIYDALGVCKTLNPDGTVNDTATFIANINPYRYRSYYYDAETGLYYLQSRYYDATVGRFVNGDEAIFGICLGGHIIYYNLGSYSCNSPVVSVDKNGFYSLAAYTVSTALYSQMAAMSAAATSLMVSIKAFISMIWNVFLVVGLLLTVVAAIIYICRTVSNIYSNIKDKINVSANEYKRFKNKICVYILSRNERVVKSVFYVGRTKNIVARYNAHLKTKGSFYMYVVYTCSSIAQSRVVEQCVLAVCLTNNYTNIFFGSAPSNKIRGISTKNAKNAIENLGDKKDETISLLGCTKESDMLFLLNK